MYAALKDALNPGIYRTGICFSPTGQIRSPLRITEKQQSFLLLGSYFYDRREEALLFLFSFSLSVLLFFL